MARRNRQKKSPVAAVCSVLGTLLLIIIVAAYLPITIPKAFGYEIYTVISGSMEPAVPTGSLVYIKYVEPGDIETGDIIAFYGSDAQGSIITHRVVSNSNAMGEFMSTADQQDLDTLLAQLEDLRSYEQPLYDFAAIDNPPEKYAEAHERLANSCTQMGDVLDEYVDFMKGVFEGTVSQDDSQALVDKMTEASNEVAQAGQALTAIE